MHILTTTKKIPHSFLALLFCILLSPIAFAECQKNRVKLQVLGSGGPEMSDQRASSSYLIWLDDNAILLVDTGPGSSYNFEKSGAKIPDLKAILYTHFHVDHSADFPMLVKASYFTERNKPLRVFGPKGNNLMPSATEFVNGLFGSTGIYRYLGDYISEVKPSPYKILTTNIPLANRTTETFQLTDSVELETIPVHHGPIPAIAWRINIAGCSITFSGDMSNRYQTLVKLARDSDILVAHNAIPEKARAVARNLHMPPSEIGKIAQSASIRKLVLSHRMKRTLGKEKETLKMIRKTFNGPVIFANDLDTINFNF